MSHLYSFLLLVVLLLLFFITFTNLKKYIGAYYINQNVPKCKKGCASCSCFHITWSSSFVTVMYILYNLKQNTTDASSNPKQKSTRMQWGPDGSVLSSFSRVSQMMNAWHFSHDILCFLITLACKHRQKPELKRTTKNRFGPAGYRPQNLIALILKMQWALLLSLVVLAWDISKPIILISNFGV